MWRWQASPACCPYLFSSTRFASMGEPSRAVEVGLTFKHLASSPGSYHGAGSAASPQTNVRSGPLTTDKHLLSVATITRSQVLESAAIPVIAVSPGTR